MIHGARSVIRVAEKKPVLSSVEGAEPGNWLKKLMDRRCQFRPTVRLDADCLPLVQQERSGSRVSQQKCPDRVGALGP